MLPQKDTARRSFATLLLATLALTIGLGCAVASTTIGTGNETDTPDGLRRTLKTLESSKRAKYHCDLLQCRAARPRDLP